MFTWLARQTRRLVTGYPSAITPEEHNAWLSEQVRAYSTPQPYAGPLTSAADNWTGETWEIREGYRRYAFKEPSVKSALLTKMMAVAQLDMQMIAFDKGDKRDREIAQWCKFAISKSIGGVPNLVWNIGIHGLVDGFSVTEKVIDVIPSESPKYGGFFTLKAGKAKDSRGIRFRLDTYKNVVGVRSMIAAQGGLEFPPSDFLIFTHLPLFENPFGISDLRAANRAANLIEASIKLRAILLENFSGPYLVGTAADSTARSRIMEILKHARARGWIVVPEGATVEVLNLATSAPDQFQSTIEDLRQEIVTAIQGAYLQLLEGGVADGRGNTQVHKSVAELFQWWLAATISSVINESLIADLVYPNYGYNVGLPTFQLGASNVQTILAELERFKRGQDLGAQLSGKQVNEVGGFESPEDDSDKLTPPNQQSNSPGATSPSSANGPMSLDDVFGPDAGAGSADKGQNSQNVQTEQTGQSKEFSEEQYASMSLADRSHLVKKVIQDKNGIHRTVWVSPQSGDHGDEQERMAPRTNAEAAVSKALLQPGSLSHEEIADLSRHLKALTVARKRELLRGLREKIGGNKAAVADRILAYVRRGLPSPRPQATLPPVTPPPAPPPVARTALPSTVREQLISQRTRDQLAEVAAGRLDPERVRDQIAQRIVDFGNRDIIRQIAIGYGFNDASPFHNQPLPQQAAQLAALAVSHAAGRTVPPNDTLPRAVSPPPPPPPPPVAPPPPPSRARSRPIVPVEHTFTSSSGTPLPTDRPRIPENISFSGGSEAAKQKLQAFFGREIDPDLFAAAVNAHDGATVHINQSYSGGLSIITRGDGYHAKRTIQRDSGGNAYIHNDYFRVNFDRNTQPPPDWIQSNRQISGSALLANQIRAARSLGMTKLETHAARADSTDPNEGMNGYYTWPRLGYDDSIGPREMGKLERQRPDLAQLVKSNPTGSAKTNSILGLMTTEEGRAWWKEHGQDLLYMELDLRADSLSMRTAAAYTRERGR